MEPSDIKLLDTATVILSDSYNTKELEDDLKVLSAKVNELVIQINKISKYLRK